RPAAAGGLRPGPDRADPAGHRGDRVHVLPGDGRGAPPDRPRDHPGVPGGPGRVREPAVAFPADRPRGGSGRLRGRDHALRWALLAGVALVAHPAFPLPAGAGTPVFAAGEVADRDVVAPVTFEVRKDAEELEREAEARA